MEKKLVMLEILDFAASSKRECYRYGVIFVLEKKDERMKVNIVKETKCLQTFMSAFWAYFTR
jgi:hypothetical protein